MLQLCTTDILKTVCTPQVMIRYGQPHPQDHYDTHSAMIPIRLSHCRKKYFNQELIKGLEFYKFAHIICFKC